MKAPFPENADIKYTLEAIAETASQLIPRLYKTRRRFRQGYFIPTPDGEFDEDLWRIRRNLSNLETQIRAAAERDRIAAICRDVINEMKENKRRG